MDVIRSNIVRVEQPAHDDGAVLTRVQVDELRSRVLATRPEPGESVAEIFARPDGYLASLGFRDEVIARALPKIRAACVSGGWSNEDGVAPEIPPELDELFALGALKRRMLEYLLRPTRDSWSVTCEIPGEPPIYLCTSSNNPDLVPWFVAVAGEHWYALDRGLAAALVELTPTDGWMRARIEEHRDWRESPWNAPGAWGDIPLRVNEALTRLSYRRLPGWTDAQRLFHVDDAVARPTPEPVLPSANLRVTRPGTIDAVHLRPEWDDHSDWTDVVAAYERAERAAGAQPWLARWKVENRGSIGVRYPPGFDPEDRFAPLARAAWEEAGLEGTPEMVLWFSFEVERHTPGGGMGHSTCGQGVLSSSGELLVLQSNSTHGPLASAGLLNSDIDRTRVYGIVRAGAAPEIRTRSASAPR